jgi:hypothetical protein
MGPRAGLGDVTTWRRENSSPYRDSNSDPSVVQPVTSRYTDYAIPVPIIIIIIIIIIIRPIPMNPMIVLSLHRCFGRPSSSSP